MKEKNKDIIKINSAVNVLCESYKITEQFDEKTGEVKAVFLEGVAITFGKPTRNRVSYIYDPSSKTHKTLEGKPFLDTHNDTSIRIHPPFGHVETCEMGVNPKNNLPCLNYKANIDPEEKDFIRKAKRGDIPGVSIQVLVDEVDEKQDSFGNYIEAHIREYLELSGVLIPGDGDSSMKITEKFNSFKKLKNSYSIDDSQKSMSDEDSNMPITKFKDDEMKLESSILPDEESEDEIDINKPVRLVGGCGRKTEVAYKGCNCPACGKQMLKDTFGENFRLRCWACEYVIQKGGKIL
jgi:hypothetical protein